MASGWRVYRTPRKIRNSYLTNRFTTLNQSNVTSCKWVRTVFIISP
jgi:hypothetical protein